MTEQEYITREEFDAKIETLLVLYDKTNERITDAKEETSRQISFWGIVVGVIAFLFAGMQIGMAIVLYLLQGFSH